MRSLSTIALLSLIAGASLGAQGRPLAANATRSLVFGSLFPGIANTVQPTDPSRSGEYSITGSKNSGVDISFVLPSSMIGAAGGTLPLYFGATSGGYTNTGAQSAMTYFDPHTHFVGTLSNDGDLSTNGRGYVFLGATALPTGSQPPGSYSASVTITVAYTGF